MSFSGIYELKEMLGSRLISTRILSPSLSLLPTLHYLGVIYLLPFVIMAYQPLYLNGDPFCNYQK